MLESNTPQIQGYLLHLPHYDPWWCGRMAEEKPFDLAVGLEIIQHSPLRASILSPLTARTRFSTAAIPNSPGTTLYQSGISISSPLLRRNMASKSCPN